MTKANIEALTKQFPLLAALIDLEEVCWFNPISLPWRKAYLMSG